MLWKWASVSIGASLLGNMEGRSLPRTFDRREFFFIEGKFCDEFERYVKKMPCKRVALSIGAMLGNLGGGGLFTVTLERKRKVLPGFLFLGP